MQAKKVVNFIRPGNAITQFITDIINPQLGEKVLDLLVELVAI